MMQISPRPPRGLAAPTRRQAVSLLAASAIGLAGLLGPRSLQAADTMSMQDEVAHGDLKIGEIWARPNLPNRPTAAYLHLKNGGAEADALIAATSAQFGKIELHTTTEKDGVMTMVHVDEIEVPAGGMVHLEPGSYHLMMFDAASVMKPGDSFMMTLTFRNAGDVEIMVPVRKAAGMSGMTDHSGHTGHGSSN